MEMQGINLNITSRDEHVPKIDRFIPTVKERKKGNSKYTTLQHIAQQTNCQNHIQRHVLAKLFSP